MRTADRLALTTALALGLTPTLGSAAALPPVREYLDAYCLSCHGPDNPKANLRLDILKPDFADAAAFATWVKVHDRVAAGEMPPKRKPPAAESSAAVAALADALTAADRQRQAAEGRTAFRRLTR